VIGCKCKSCAVQLGLHAVGKNEAGVKYSKYEKEDNSVSLMDVEATLFGWHSLL